MVRGVPLLLILLDHHFIRPIPLLHNIMPRQIEQSVPGRRIPTLEPNQRTAIVNFTGSDWPLFASSDEIYLSSLRHHAQPGQPSRIWCSGP